MTKTAYRRGLAAALTLGFATLLANTAWADLDNTPRNKTFGARTELDWNGASHAENEGQFYASNSFQSPRSMASGAAASDLTSGTLRASSSVFLGGGCVPTDSGPCGGTAFMTSRAVMFDKVDFYQKGEGPIEPLGLIPTQMAIDGMLGGYGASARVRVYQGYDADFNVDSLEWITLGEGKTEILDLFLPLTTQSMYVYIELETKAATNGQYSDYSIADFGHTLRYSWDVPDNVGYTSASGKFLTDVPSAVPEPATWALMITGFGLVGGTLRRRIITLTT